MIKRPIDKRFRAAVLDGRKTTTIRNKPWRTGTHVMLYSWSGKPYASPQDNLCPVTVIKTSVIAISNDRGTMSYDCALHPVKDLWKTEGFNSQAEMDDWFRPLVKSGRQVTKALMVFQQWGNGGKE